MMSIRCVQGNDAHAHTWSDISQVFEVDDILGVLKDIQGNRQGENGFRITLTTSHLPVQVIDPFHGLYVADFPKVSFGC